MAVTWMCCTTLQMLPGPGHPKQYASTRRGPCMWPRRFQMPGNLLIRWIGSPPGEVPTLLTRSALGGLISRIRRGVAVTLALTLVALGAPIYRMPRGLAVTLAILQRR